MSSGTLVIIACNEREARIEPSIFFNLTASGDTRVIKTVGGRAGHIPNYLHTIDQASRIGMIVVLQHSGCVWSPGDIEANVRSDIATLKSSPHIRKEIPIVGYALSAATEQLKEVNIQRSTQDESARQQILQEFQDFAPFWG